MKENNNAEVLPPERLSIITDTQKLRIKAQKVSKWSGERVGLKLIKFIAFNELKCFGLAATQLGIYKRVFVLFDGKDFAIFINPRIIQTGPLQEEQQEGCLSIPGKRFIVKRPTSILVKDAVRTQPLELTGLTARVYLHEIDHLNGVLISDIGTQIDEQTEEVIQEI